MVLSKNVSVLFPATGPAAPSNTHYSACILGSPNPLQSTPKVSVTAPHHVTPASTGRSTKQLRQTLNGRASGPRLQRPGIPVSQKQLGERVPPQSCTRSCGWGPRELAARGSDQQRRGVRGRRRQAETQARHAARRSPRAGLRPRGPARTLTPGEVSAASRPLLRRPPPAQGPDGRERDGVLGCLRRAVMTSQPRCSRRLSKKKITFLGWIEDWARLYRRDDA